MDKQICIGTVVLSKSGRDKGRYFVVCKTDKDYIYIADGALRKVAKPKKKKIKHVTVTYDRLETIGKKLEQGIKVFDIELKSALRAYNEKQV
jgi:ribosomal protein L14E/L6E/L27E